MSKIFVLMGKSATGKDTIFKKLVENDQVELKTVVLYTTRPKREKETDGVEYFFVEKQTLEQLKEEHKVIEHRAYQTVHGEWNYFTVEDGQIDIKKHNYIMIGTLEALSQLRNYFGDEVVVPIYIELEDKIRIHRAIEREDMQGNPKYLEMCRRFLADEEDFSVKKLTQARIVRRYQNIEIERCVQEIVGDIAHEL